jgi:hypothetical protein
MIIHQFYFGRFHSKKIVKTKFYSISGNQKLKKQSLLVFLIWQIKFLSLSGCVPVKLDITFPGHSPNARGRISPLNAWPICGRICGRFVDCCAEVEGIARELGKIRGVG